MQELLGVLVAIATILIAILYFSYRKKPIYGEPRKARRNIQKVIHGALPSDPVFGNLLDIKEAGGFHYYLEKLHKKHGDVVSLWWGKQRIVSICSPEAYKETSKLFDRPEIFFSPFVPMIGDKSIQLTNGDEGKERIASYVKKPFSMETIHQTIWPTFIKIIEGTRDRWLSSKEPIGIHKECINHSLMGILSSSLGIPTDDFEKVSQIQNAYNFCWTVMSEKLEGKIPDEQKQKEFDEQMNIVHGLADDIIKRKSEGKDTQNYPFIDALVTHAKDIDIIKSDVVTFLVGGFHTTGNALTWMFYYLSKNPEIQEKIRKEVATVWNHEGPLTPQDVNALKYTKQVVNETLRIITLPFAARYSTEDIQVRGYTIEKNTPILQALSVTMTSDQYWENPNQFNPDRFSNEIKNLSFVPFGFAGRRICPGQTYSMSMLILTAAMIISKCRIEFVPGQADPVPIVALVNRPRDEIYVNVSEVK